MVERKTAGAQRGCLASPLREFQFAVLALAFFGILPAEAQSPDAITKPVSIYVAGTSGGGIDLYARLLGRHIGKYIDGHPTVDVQDMPGAGGIRAANFLAKEAPKDGTALATYPGGPLSEPLIGARNPGYDMSQFQWIGAISKDVSVCISWSAGPFQTIQDAMKKQMVVAGTGAGSETDTYPALLNAALGTKFKLITGYLGTKETFLAIENHEVDGRCGLTYSSLKATKPDWIRDKKVNILLQIGSEKSAELPNVPLAFDLIKNEQDKQLLGLLMTGTVIGRPFAAPPGTPAGKVENLRKAFVATMKDPEFLADASKIQAEISPTPGAEVQKIVDKVYATPKPVIERAKQLLAPK